MVRLDELRTPLSRGETIKFVPNTTIYQNLQQPQQLHAYEVPRVFTAETPLKTVTNSPILRPDQAPPPLVLFALGEPADELPPAKGAARSSTFKKIPPRDGHAKCQVRRALSRAGRMHSLRTQPAGVDSTETEMEQLPRPSPAVLEDPGAVDIDFPELNSPVLAECSVLEMLPGLPQDKPPASKEAALFDDSAFDLTLYDGIPLPPSDVAIEDECEHTVVQAGGTTLQAPMPAPSGSTTVCGPVSPHTPRDFVSIRFKDRCLEFGSLRCLSAAQLRKQIATQFKLASSAFVLRTDEVADAGFGCIVPLACCLAPGSGGAAFCLEVPAADSLATGDSSSFEMQVQPPSPVDECTTLRWVQEPPHTTCHWLTAKTSDFSTDSAPPCTWSSSSRHCFDPPPAVAFAGVKSKELSALLERALVTLWTPHFKDVSQHLHVGPCEVSFLESCGEVTLRWPSMAITELPNNVVGEVIGLPRGPACHQGGRGGKGWFHLRVDVPTIGRLWLKNRAATSPAQIVLKHRRCVQTGRWKEREIGPYADHALCRLAGSHIDAKTGRKLCKESCCFGARNKMNSTTVKPAPAEPN
jgi:hypothetical protein